MAVPPFLPRPSREACEETGRVPADQGISDSHPVKLTEDKGMAIVELAKLQHARGIPFEYVVVCRESMPEGMVWRRG